MQFDNRVTMARKEEASIEYQTRWFIFVHLKLPNGSHPKVIENLTSDSSHQKYQSRRDYMA